MIDERTGRPFGDHGTAGQALDFALNPLNFNVHAVPAEQIDFLREWREGGAFDGWPQFYTWLAELEGGVQDAPSAIGRTELTGGEDA